MKIFSKEKFIEQEGIQLYNYSKVWVDKCDGKNVVNGLCTIDPATVFHIRDCWCIEAPSPLDVCAEAARNAAKAILDAAAKILMPSKYRIIIESDGDTTTATMTINGVEVKKAQTKRNPQDKPNWKIGAQMAFGRLWDKKVTANDDSHACNCRCVMKKPTQFREVKRHAKNGEYIKVVSPYATGGFYRAGDIRRVFCQGAVSPNMVYIDGSNEPVDDCEYVVLEGMAEHVAGGGKHE